MLSLGLGVSAAILWGFADFLAGMQSRRVSPVLVTGVSQASSLLLIALVFIVAAPARLSEHDALLAALAGASVAIGIASLYAALAQGTMTIVAPIAASGVVIPVIFGLVSGERPRPLQLLGVVATMMGVILVSRQDSAARGDRYRRSIGLALIAALGFGWFFVAMGEASGSGLVWPLLTSRGAAVAVLGAMLLYLRPKLTGIGPAALPMVAIGLLDLAATSAYVLATSQGLLSLVSVLGSLYAVVTILLARALLHEHISRVQGAGVLCAMAGVASISAAS